MPEKSHLVLTILLWSKSCGIYSKMWFCWRQIYLFSFFWQKYL